MHVSANRVDIVFSDRNRSQAGNNRSKSFSNRVSGWYIRVLTHEIQLQASKAERQQLLAAIHPHACDGANNLAEEALMAVKGVLECSDTDAKQLAEESGTSSAIQSLKQGLKSHLNSICHVESYVVEDVQCKRDLLQMCNEIDNMPCLTAEGHTEKSTSKHQEL